MIPQPNFMIVSGNGRNTGKTTFVCRAIKRVSQSYPVTAIKVSPHFHIDKNEEGVLVRAKNYIVRKEAAPDNSKDSSRMLKNGAKNVYYIEVKDNYLREAMEALKQLVPLDGPVICESGGMRQIIKPSLFFMVNSHDKKAFKDGFKSLSPLADRIILFDGSNFDFPPEKIGFNGMKWLTEWPDAPTTGMSSYA